MIKMKNKDIIIGIKNIQSLINLLHKEITLDNTGYDREEYNYCQHYFEEANEYLDGVIHYLKKARDEDNDTQ